MTPYNDHQGSISKITNSDGSSDVSESFTAFGDRRNPVTWSGAPASTDLNNINAVTRDGYTGQTALGSMGLNHMNGRVEDAITGRFLSADPFITEPGNTQNYNRYSYVLNNPLSYTDPTGFDDTKCNVDQKGAQDSRGSDTAVTCNPSGNGGGSNYGDGTSGGNTNNDNLPTLIISGWQMCNAACQLQGLANFDTMTWLNKVDIAQSIVPPPNLPGGPYTPTPPGSGQRPGNFQGPKQPKGARWRAQRVPGHDTPGGNRSAPESYWKVNEPLDGGGSKTRWFRDDGTETTPEDIHPTNQLPESEPIEPIEVAPVVATSPAVVIVAAIVLSLWPSPAY